MLTRIKNLRVGHKLGLMVALMGIPIALLAILFVQAKNQQMAAMQKQLDSLDYLTPVHNLQQHVLLHGGLVFISVSDPSYRPRLATNEADVDTDISAVQRADAKYGKAFGTTEALNRIREHWEEIRSRLNISNAKDMNDAHARLSAEILDLIREVGDNAVITDTSLDTYYLGNGLLLQIPGAADSIGQLRYAGSEAAISGSVTPDQQNRMTAIIANIRRFSAPKTGLIQIGLTTSGKANSKIEERLRGPLSAATMASEAYVQSVQENILGAKVSASLKDHFTTATDAIATMFRLYDAVDAAYRAEANARIEGLKSAEYLQLSVALFGLALAVFLVYLITRGVNRQVHSMMKLFSSIGVGDFSARAEVLSEDELGRATASLNSMLGAVLGLIQSRQERDQIQESIRKLLEEISGLAEGDLTKQAEVTAEITGAIADAFNNMTDELRSIISKVQDTTLAVSFSANEVQNTTENLATGSESQALQIVEASAAIDQMTVSIQQVSGNAATAAGVAEHALGSAKAGAEAVMKTIDGMNGIRQQVQQTAKRMKRLGESSQEIGEIVQLIKDITERTTILALNASIQAAMAGDAGKGFAVVAEEVERLAEHSTEATKKISGLIKSIQSDTNEAIAAMEETTREVVAESGLANEAGQKLAEIEKISKQLAEIIQSISLASKQQSRGSEGVAKSMAEISQVTQQTAAGAKQAAISIRKLTELADDLRGSLNRFRLPKKAA
ncbi:MAG TPA: methyl-accepting chemotaxis protein [Candidatus Acidoferrales bacterium]|nr:methyl-accepting chemotaxis protein [Candidatus Acidoferrales bacterium]